jgi:hypothetical protein
MDSDEKIVLEIPKDKFSYLNSILTSHKEFLHKLGINKAIKDNLVRDVHIVKNIIETSKKGV